VLVQGLGMPVEEYLKALLLYLFGDFYAESTDFMSARHAMGVSTHLMLWAGI